jgi:outer membrane lipoprotein SlyB
MSGSPARRRRFVEGGTIMTQRTLDMHAAFAAPALRAPAAARRLVGAAIAGSGAAVLIAHALGAIAHVAGA